MITPEAITIRLDPDPVTVEDLPGSTERLDAENRHERWFNHPLPIDYVLVQEFGRRHKLRRAYETIRREAPVPVVGFYPDRAETNAGCADGVEALMGRLFAASYGPAKPGKLESLHLKPKLSEEYDGFVTINEQYPVTGKLLSLVHELSHYACEQAGCTDPSTDHIRSEAHAERLTHRLLQSWDSQGLILLCLHRTMASLTSGGSVPEGVDDRQGLGTIKARKTLGYYAGLSSPVARSNHETVHDLIGRYWTQGQWIRQPAGHYRRLIDDTPDKLISYLSGRKDVDDVFEQPLKRISGEDAATVKQARDEPCPGWELLQPRLPALA